MTGKINLINLCPILFEREALKRGGVISHIKFIAIFTASGGENYTRFSLLKKKAISYKVDRKYLQIFLLSPLEHCAVRKCLGTRRKHVVLGLVLVVASESKCIREKQIDTVHNQSF